MNNFDTQLTTSIGDVPGIRVGHAQDFAAKTGCTVIIPENGAVAGVDVRGSAPGTREIAAIQLTRLVEKIHAVLLTGGSAFGLEAASGVIQYLEEHQIGYDTGDARVPIVPTAVIYDLGVGQANIRPDKAMGYQACLNAHLKNAAEGQLGVGTGATVGKIAGQAQAMNGGIGTVSFTLSNGITIGVLTVVNALGDVISAQTGEIIAGARTKDGKGFLNTIEFLKQAVPGSFSQSNTTLVVVATDATLTREEVTKLAQVAHDGLAQVIRPVHTIYDGDIVFGLATGMNQRANLLQMGAIAAELVAESIQRAVKIANPRGASTRSET